LALRGGSEIDFLFFPRGIERCEVHRIWVRPLQQFLDSLALGLLLGNRNQCIKDSLVVRLAALQTLGISSIVDPAVLVLQTVLNAIPHVLAATILLAIGWFVGRWVRGLIEQILPSLGFDRALIGLGGFTPATLPSRVVGAIALTAIMLFAAIEAARLLDFDAVSLMLVQLTDLGGRVIFGSAIIVIGVIMARIVTRLVGESVGESGLPSILKYAIIALAVAIGLRFMGLANEIVNLAFGLILGAAAVAVALAFGLGGRQTAHKLLERWTDDKPAP